MAGKTKLEELCRTDVMQAQEYTTPGLFYMSQLITLVLPV